MNSEVLKNHLMRPESYPHSTDQIEIRETHISWVFLTGKYAYKVKKPVNLGFVDFSQLEGRHRFCHDEVIRNRQFCSGIYLDVVPIAGKGKGLLVGGPGAAVEFAVKMRQFDEDHLASRLVQHGQLLPEELNQLASHIAECHQRALRAEPGRWGEPDRVAAAALENCRVLRKMSSLPEQLDKISRIEHWTGNALQELKACFQRRCSDGFIRQCHGDLHLDNIVRWQGKLTPFDAIEFNPDFFWIDVMSEIAFLMMDLQDHQANRLGWRFINSYLEVTGDYQGLEVLPFYLVYRAMVRAKVGCLRAQQPGVAAAEREQLEQLWLAYLDMADLYMNPRSVSLTITHGVSGSGKSHGSQILADKIGAIRVRSDVQRKRLFVDWGTASPNDSKAEEKLYSHSATEQTYQRMLELTALVLRAGFPVIVDATFLLQKQRELFQSLAQQMQVPYSIYAFHADSETLRSRIRARNIKGEDPSDADERVLEKQLSILQPLSQQEQGYLANP